MYVKYGHSYFTHVDRHVRYQHGYVKTTLALFYRVSGVITLVLTSILQPLH